MSARKARATLAADIQGAVPAARSLSQAHVEVQLPREDGDLPVVVNGTADVDLISWTQAHGGRIHAWLREYGACLLRGFQMASAESFGEVADAIAGSRMRYTNRSSPRTTVGDRIYTSTDYPSHLPIFPHNEHGYSPIVPLYLFFCCMQPADTGGATPLGSTRRVADAIAPEIRRRFRERRIMYVRNYHTGFGVPWQEAFQTADKADVERYCAARGIECEWRANGILRTRRIGPAEIPHPRTGEIVWFNHGTFYHVSTLPAAIRDELLTGFDEDDLPNQTYYGDGSPIEPQVLEHLRAAYESSMRRFDWRTADVLAVDNLLTVHARDPYTGPRRVLVSMAEEIRVS